MRDQGGRGRGLQSSPCTVPFRQGATAVSSLLGCVHTGSPGQPVLLWTLPVSDGVLTFARSSAATLSLQGLKSSIAILNTPD